MAPYPVDTINHEELRAVLARFGVDATRVQSAKDEVPERYWDVVWLELNSGPIQQVQVRPCPEGDGRPLELEDVVGVVVRKGTELGVPIPTISRCYEFLMPYVDGTGRPRSGDEAR